MQKDGPRYIKDINTHLKYCVRKEGHPFGLDVPPDDFFRTEVLFLGASGSDMNVENFLYGIRTLMGYTDGSRAHKLRVIQVPIQSDRGKQHYVFFEAWVAHRVYISGETTDHSGAGNQAREELESVFEILSYTYGIPIERVTVPVRGSISHFIDKLRYE